MYNINISKFYLKDNVIRKKCYICPIESTVFYEIKFLLNFLLHNAE